MTSDDTNRHTVRELLSRYEQHKHDTDPATAMIEACNEMLAEIEQSQNTGTERDSQ